MNGALESGGEGERRARTLRGVLPSVVHRLNNTLAFVQGTCELEVRGDLRQPLLERLDALGAALERLGLLAHDPDLCLTEVDLHGFFRGLELLLPCERGIDFRVFGSAAFLVDGRFEERLLSACDAVLGARGLARARRLRLVARVRSNGIHLRLSAGSVVPPAVWAGLVEHARECGWETRLRSSGESCALGILIPALPGASPEPPSPRATEAHSVLLLYDAGEERELMATVLRERGHHVLAREREPERGSYSIVLLQRSRLEADHGLGARLVASHAGARIETVDARMRPETLLELVRGRS